MTKSLIRQRWEKGAVCPICKSPDYKIYRNDSFEGANPNIKCNSCGHIWQYGKDTGVYGELTNERYVCNYR